MNIKNILVVVLSFSSFLAFANIQKEPANIKNVARPSETSKSKAASRWKIQITIQQGTNITVTNVEYRVVSIQTNCGTRFVMSWPVPKDFSYPVIIEYDNTAKVVKIEPILKPLDAFWEKQPEEVKRANQMLESIRFAVETTMPGAKEVNICFAYVSVPLFAITPIRVLDNPKEIIDGRILEVQPPK
jgi:hypothetical protein